MKDQNKLRSIFFQESELFFSIYDKNFNCIDCNDAFAKVFKSNRESIIGKNLCEISPNVKENGRLELYENVLKTGKPLQIDVMQPDPSIGNYFFRIRAFKIQEGLGIIAKDTSDFVEAVNRFNYATKASREIIYEKKIYDSFMWVNDYFFDFFGLNNDNNNILETKTFTKYIHEDDLENFKNNISNLVNCKSNYHINEFRFIDKHQQINYFSERAFLVRDNQNQPVKVIGTLSNITHWKVHTQHLEEMLFTLSHKVRVPISNLLGIMYLIENDYINENEFKSILVDLKNQIKNLDVLVSSMSKQISELKEKNRY